jgi:hypothetical protein
MKKTSSRDGMCLNLRVERAARIFKVHRQAKKETSTEKVLPEIY